MAGYYNHQQAPPPSGYGNSFSPPFPPAQQSPPYNVNAYSAPTAYDAHQQQHHSQYSPTQAMYGHEPTTPVLDQNQMNWFFNEVRSGNIPTIPPAQSQPQLQQAFAPPPPPPVPQMQPPPQQSYAHPQQQYQYPTQYATQTRNDPQQLQGAFQPQQQSSTQYNAGQDVAMEDAYKDDDWSDEDDEYAPPDINTNNGNLNGTGEGLPGLGQNAQGKRPAQSSEAQPPAPFNPFRSQSLHNPPAPPAQPTAQTQSAPKSVPTKQQQPAQLNLALRDKAGDAVKDFHARGIGFSQLAQEPNFDEFDKAVLKQLYAQYNIPQEAVQVPVEAPAPQPVNGSGGERLSEMKRLLASAGFEIDDAILANLANAKALPAIPAALIPQEAAPAATLPGLGATPAHQQQQDARPTPPGRPLSTSIPGAEATEGRNAYLAKLKAMKGKSAASQQSTPVQAGAKSSLPGLGASTPRRAMINQEALKRKLLEKREALARATAAGTADRPVPAHMESMSDIAYESGQVSAQSGSDATNTPVMDMSSPEEGEELEEGEEMEGPDPEEIVEPLVQQPPSTTLQPAAPIVGLPPKPPETSTVPSHVRNDSDQSARASPRAGLPARPPAARQPYPYPPAVHSPSQYGRPWQPDLKRPASSAFGSPWNPQAKRQYPPQQGIDDAPEPVVIDISSEEEDGDDGEMSEGEVEDAQPQQAPRTPWKSAQQHASGTSSAAFAPTPPVEVATPDPVVAARQEEHAKQKALIEAKRDALKRQIQLKEARKNQVASGTMSPSTAVIGATLSSPVAPSKSALSAMRSSSVMSRSSSVSVARQAALKSLEADIRTDEEQMEALQAQMERLRQEVARKNKEKELLAEEIKAFGVDPEGMSHQQMREVRDTLAEEAEAEAEAQQAMADEEDFEDDEEEGEVDESSEEDEDDAEMPLERIQPNNPSDIPEANDPRALSSGARVQIHNVSFGANKLSLRHLLRDYDITGISLPLHTNKKRGNPKKKAGYAYVDFLYPAEVDDAIQALKGKKLGGLPLSVSRVPRVQPKGAKLEQARSLPPPKVVGKPSTATGQQSGGVTTVQGAAAHIPQQILVSNLAERLCNPKSFQGWAGRFVNSASNVEFPKDKATGKPLGMVYLELPDLRTAQKFVEVTMARATKKNAYRVEIVNERHREQEEPVAFGFMQALTGAGVPAQQGSDAVDEPVGEQEESSGSESDDEEEGEDEEEEQDDEEDEDEDEDDDAMSVSEDGSEEGELAEDDEVEAPPVVERHSVPAVEDSDDDAEEESDEMDVSEAGSDDSESEDEHQDDTRDAGVSLRDVKNAQPMDEDAAQESEEEGSDGEERSDDEEGESEGEEVVEDTLPLGDEEESEEESDEDAEGEVDEVPEAVVPAPVVEHQAPVSIEAIARQDHIPAETIAQNDSEDDAEGSVDEEVEEDVHDENMTGVEETVVPQPSLAAPTQQPIANTSSSEAFHSAPADVEMVEEDDWFDNDNDEDFYEQDDAGATAQATVPQQAPAPEDNDDDFYEPNAGDAPVTTEPRGPESGEEDEYDPDFDAAFEEAFAEIDGDSVQSAGGIATTDHVQSQPEKKLGEVGEGNEKEDAEVEEAQPEPTSGGGGLPGNGMLNGDAELSEDGEILSESGDGGEAETEAAAAAIDHAVSSPSFVVPAPAHADDHFDHPPQQHYYPGRSTSPRIKFPIPKMRALGTQGQSTDVSRISEAVTTTNKGPDTFRPYESPLKSLKAYRYHPSYNADVKGGIRSLSYSNRLDPGQPLCPTELEGGTCRDPAQCAGQHLKDAAFSDSDIVKLIGTIDPSRPQEEKNRWSAGVKQVISEIQGKNITDLDRIAEKVVAYRHAFFGNSILGLDAPKTTVEDVSHQSDDEMSDDEGQEGDKW